MKRLNNDAFKAISPGLHFATSSVSSVLFWISLPFGVLLGSVWEGIRVGFVVGRDIY